MSEKTLKGIIDEIVDDAFKRVEYAYRHNREGKEKEDVRLSEKEIATRLIFPKYANKGTRISEQELRFAFVEAFNAKTNNDFFYSIETPTAKKYSDFSTNPQQVDNGRSAEFDMVIFKKVDKKLKRVCLIEFKAKSVDKIDYWKDILKLIEDRKDSIYDKEEVLSYFINLFGSSNRDTIPTMKEKIQAFVNERGYGNEKNIVIKYYVLGKAVDGFIALKDS